MGKHAKFDLRIVGVYQNVSVFRFECFSELTPEFGPDGDVLQIRLGRTDAPRLCHGLSENGVYAPVIADLFQKPVYISLFQF